MSGVFGILNLDGGLVRSGDLTVMASVLARRGPEGAALWSDEQVGLGHTLLPTTPELLFERQPVFHSASGCVISADVRLDNRKELLHRLNLSDRAGTMGDAGLILEAYLAWGSSCPEHLLGDFAFAIWDPRSRAVFCARDHFGMRPFYYHHTPGRHFIFASEPRAIVSLAQVPYQLNEGRVADFLVPSLQWIDYTSTFFEQVFRLPPAAALTVTVSGLSQRRYWTLEPGPELRLASDQAYAEGLREVLKVAVESRLRASGPVGATLSGGLDSGTVVALGSELLSAQGSGPLATFSGTGPDDSDCAETAAIGASMAMPGIAPTVADYSALGDLLPDLERLTWSPDEPFDASMVLLSALYLTARRQGICVVLDGAGADVVLSEGTHLMRLWRQGRWASALRDMSRSGSPWRSVRAALTPDVARRVGRRALSARRAAARVRQSIISPEFAARISIEGRLTTLDETQGQDWIDDYHREVAAAIHPNLTAGRERYSRVASAVGVEARDPFLDRRVVEFCVTLPGAQRIRNGWSKLVLRRAMEGRLPDQVTWRRGKEHLGWSFRASVLKAGEARIREQQAELLLALRPYVSHAAVATAFADYFDRGDATQQELVLTATILARWLLASARRPVAMGTGTC